jgi:CheY-like chemotaxis protein
VNPPRVLVVHDVPAARKLVAHALEAKGCTAIGVEDCRTATALETLDPPDVIVADERIIDADLAAFQAMRGHYPKAIVVALAAPMRLRRGGRQGVDCMVEKPVRDEQLLRAIRWALELTDAVP